jgi:hypothetical protein
MEVCPNKYLRKLFSATSYPSEWIDDEPRRACARHDVRQQLQVGSRCSRKHHYRHCGCVCSSDCSANSEFDRDVSLPDRLDSSGRVTTGGKSVKDPQRVCKTCNAVLKLRSAQKESKSGSIARVLGSGAVRVGRRHVSPELDRQAGERYLHVQRTHKTERKKEKKKEEKEMSRGPVVLHVGCWRSSKGRPRRSTGSPARRPATEPSWSLDPRASTNATGQSRLEVRGTEMFAASASWHHNGPVSHTLYRVCKGTDGTNIDCCMRARITRRCGVSATFSVSPTVSEACVLATEEAPPRPAPPRRD